MEGQPHAPDWVFNHSSDDTMETEFGRVDAFWKTSLGQAVSEYRTTRPYYVTPIQETTTPSN